MLLIQPGFGLSIKKGHMFGEKEVSTKNGVDTVAIYQYLLAKQGGNKLLVYMRQSSI
ncbi:hypothetical protein Q2Y76_004086 [Escherichia coli]|nr:hypothetical protein [Escherichia coli]